MFPNPNIPLLTDLYQMTMAQAYQESGKENQRAVFYMHFRENPFGSGYTIFAGLETFLKAIQDYRFKKEHIEYLKTLKDASGKQLLSNDFLNFLENFQFSLDIYSVPEGTCVFPYEPIVRVEGKITECQMIETLLLNLVNFQTLVATKAARISGIAGSEPVLEFGLRRSQGPDGGISASRAAYIGGCAATSNLAAGYFYNIPVRGTHAHSWIMSFEEEEEAFHAFGKVFPANCIFLVDTYDTKTGIQKAIAAANRIPDPKKNFLGIRIDSGDLCYFSKIGRQLLDEAGFTNAQIFAGNSLDETIIGSLKDQGAKINVWAIGTKLVTCSDDSALSGVYKLSATRNPGEDWKPKIKISEDLNKITLPGKPQIRRYSKKGLNIGDVIFDELSQVSSERILHGINLRNPFQRYTPDASADFSDLLIPVVKNGEIIYSMPKIDEIRQNAIKQLSNLDDSIRRIVNPHQYPAGVEKKLYQSLQNQISQRKKMKG